MGAAERHRAEYPDYNISLPAHLVPCSAATGLGTDDLSRALQQVLQGGRKWRPDADFDDEFLLMRDRESRTSGLSSSRNAQETPEQESTSEDAPSDVGTAEQVGANPQGDDAELEESEELEEGEAYQEFEEDEEGEYLEGDDDMADVEEEEEEDGEAAADEEPVEPLTEEELRLLKMSDEELEDYVP